ncbi:MAG TPA: FG-GAP-like repeat-containing protein, partial [Ilumatobacteraceae bacterium]
VSIADLNQLTRAIALADVDGDGDLDVAVGNYGTENRIYYFNVTSFVDASPSELSQDEYFTTSLAFGDITGDGRPDLVAGSLKPTLAVAGSLVVSTVVTTTGAVIRAGTEDDLTEVDSDTSVTLDAHDALDIVAGSGAGADGATASIGGSAVLVTVVRDVHARIEAFVDVAIALGSGLTDPAQLVVSATATESIITLAEGESDAVLGAISVSGTFELVTSSVVAEIAGAHIDADSLSGVDQSVVVTATETSTIVSSADTEADGGDAALAGAAAAAARNRTVLASITGGAILAVQNDVTVNADSVETILLDAAGTGQADTLGVAGSGAVIITAGSVRAVIDGVALDDEGEVVNPTTVVAGGNVVVAAHRSLNAGVLTGTGATGGTAGAGVSATAVVSTVLTEALVDAEVDARGAHDPVNVFVDRTPAGAVVMRDVRGLVVSATSEHLMSLISVSGSAAPLGSAIGSANLVILAGTTRASIGAAAKVGTKPNIDNDQGVIVFADSSLETTGIAGSATAAFGASAGGSIDAVVVAHTTEASILGQVVSQRDVEVRALSRVTILSMSGTANAALVGTLAIAGGTHVLVHVTRAHISGDADVTADGSVVVVADTVTDVDVYAGAASVSLLGSVVPSAALIVLNETTEAFIGSDVHVTAFGLEAPFVTNDGTFTTNYLLEPSNIPGLVVLALLGAVGFIFDNPVRLLLEAAIEDLGEIEDISGEVDFLDLTPVNAPELDQDIGFEPEVLVNRSGIRGVAVTATARNAVDAFTLGLTAAGVAGGSGSVTALLDAGDTKAYIDVDASVNADLTGVGASQDVLVGAGSDLRHKGIAGAGTVTGVSLVSIGGAADVAVVRHVTEAYIGVGAIVRATRDVKVHANGRIDVLFFAAGAASSNAGQIITAAGALPVVSADVTVHSHIDGVVSALGNVEVRADEET